MDPGTVEVSREVLLRTNGSYHRIATTGDDQRVGRCALITCKGTIFERSFLVVNPTTGEHGSAPFRFCSQAGCRCEFAREN